ncbi:MAG: M48 family metalloprotease [Acidobacteriota bacterium]|nr:M48 family metalloprotease [Acidobacteriota bacterium]
MNKKHHAGRRSLATILLTLAILAGPLMVAHAISDLHFKPGFNLYTPQQDVALGANNAKQIEQQMPMLNDAETLKYINALGKRLASFAPNNLPEYAWQFHVVNTNDINAFALPGGYIFVNRGTIEAAEDEAQLAGVMAHEEGHVVMRHGTHMASEKGLVEAPLSILGGLLGSTGSIVGTLTRAGLGFGINSMFLKNSRDIEAQADQVGTYILYRAGYDPHAMAQFFQILQEKYPQQTIQFFSDHPNPGNRIKAVDAEIPLLGPPRKEIKDTPEFEKVKKYLKSLPPPAPKKSAGGGAGIG